MEIRFRLGWVEFQDLGSKTFKLDGARSLFTDYVNRVSKFIPCQVFGSILRDELGKTRGKIWVCDHALEAKELSSEKLAVALEKLMVSGVRQLHIVIGGPDGFSKKELDELKPDLRWSFGPMTLPHELAAVVASEQIYRAFTIIRKMPYHSGH